MELLNYYLVSSICLALAYLGYKTFFRKKVGYMQSRIFILAALLFSLVLPLSQVSFDIGLDIAQNTTTSTKTVDQTQEEQIENNHATLNAEGEIASPIIPEKRSSIPFQTILFYLILIGSCIMLGRLIVHVFKIIHIYSGGQRIKKENYVLVISKKVKGDFSFFRWIFLSKDKQDEDIDIILAHEKTHASQVHSADILFIELLAAVMWFNPVVWLFRKELRTLHEYLADEGVLGTGIDRLKYQALLLNQICEERLICLSSSFNHSLIKKRMIMMTKQKFNPKAKLRTLMLIPLAALLFFVVGCINGQQADEEPVVAAIAPVKMNVLYIGVENPMKIAVSGYKSSELAVSVTNGEISGSSGNYIVRPKRPGIAYVVVTHGGDTIQKTEFRVKLVPDPVVKIAGIKGGAIKKDLLLEQKGLVAEIEYFDFDLTFRVVEFVVSATIDGYVKDAKSNSTMLTSEQKKIIEQLKRGNKVYFESIKLVGPDGNIRNAPSISLLIDE